MKLKALLQGMSLQVKGSKEKEITGISSDSRQTAPGHLFIAKKGASYDGHQFIPQAVENGAVAIVSELYDPFLTQTTQIVHPHPEEIESLLASRFHGQPSHKLFVFGVTGTNGKTTTTYLVKHLLDHSKQPAGLVGTVETIVQNKQFASTHTTHDVVTNHRLLRDMVQAGCKAAILEVSSHGLKQGRMNEICFDAALFTNLTPDHLDYHPNMADYLASKAKLFAFLDKSPKKRKCAIVNADDPASEAMLQQCPMAQHIRFGLGPKAEVRAEQIQMSASGTTFIVQGVLFSTTLIGRFNVYNLLGAISLGLFLKIDLEQMAKIFSTFKTAPGRLERVGESVFVDYAHTEDALKNVLSTLKELKPRRIIVVFGAGGNRDPGRRTGLARAAVEGGDLLIVTSDNPRKEDPEEICRQILSAIVDRSKVCVELDRKRAIERAIDAAEEGDVVLIAGKGHEKVQIFADKQVHFDDCEIARNAIELAVKLQHPALAKQCRL